jgi:hypothetical protein
VPHEGTRGLVEEDAGRACRQADAGPRRWAAWNGVRAGELRAGGVVVLARTATGLMSRLDRRDLASLPRVQHGKGDRDAEDSETQSGGDAPSVGPARRYDGWAQMSPRLAGNFGFECDKAC